MNNWEESVRAFHNKFGCFERDKVGWPPYDVMRARMKLISEEFCELRHEIEGDGSVQTVAKEAADLIYAVIGLAVNCGFNMDAVFCAVHGSNMTKSHMAESGKVVKGRDFVECDLEGVV